VFPDEPEVNDPVEEIEPQLEAVEENDVIADLSRENAELKDQLLRTLADFQNYRKRAAQEKIDLRKYATESLVHDLLPILDNFERTVLAANSGAELSAIVEGVDIVYRQLVGVLSGVQLKRIRAVGSAFDPNLHEAVASEEVADSESGTVLEEIQAGYQLDDKVIRPAKVKVTQ
jgi:molecular chaperone GrpE